MTQRVSKERRTLSKEEFARILIEKLEIVKKEQEQVYLKLGHFVILCSCQWFWKKYFAYVGC